MTKGVANLNPGNIKYGPGVAKLKGLASPPSDGTFCRFVSMPMGVRAIAVVFETYYDKHGLATPKALVERWAPPGVDGNPNSTYAKFVARKLSANLDDTLDLHDADTMETLVRAIIQFENGAMVCTDDQIRAGMVAAGFRPDVKPLASTRTVAASSVAAASTLGGGVVEQLRAGIDQISPFATYSKWIGIACGVLTLVAVGVIVYERVKKSQAGIA